MHPRRLFRRILAASASLSLPLLGVLSPVHASDTNGAGSLAEPFRVEADGKPIDVEVGHAAPFVGDFDGDGKPDLLVGQFDGGKLRVYRNTGTACAPKFDTYTYFVAGGQTGRVPVG